MIKTVFFDLDGTLTDPFEGITNSVVYALKKFNIEVGDKRELIKFIGPPLVESFGVFYSFNKSDALKAVDYYREYFSVKGIFENAVYDGIVPMLEELKARGLKLVLATSKPEKFAREILNHFELTAYFDFVAGATMDCTRLTKSDVIKYALTSCGTGERVIMVGDRKHDIEGAKQNGLPSLGVLYGYGSQAELLAAGADYLAKSPSEIPKIIFNAP